MRHEADYDAQPNHPPYRDAPPKRRTYMVTDLGQRVARLEERVGKLEYSGDTKLVWDGKTLRVGKLEFRG